ncbi:hypothetical protein PTKU46_74920 [Paraburkholderia terrae]
MLRPVAADSAKRAERDAGAVRFNKRGHHARYHADPAHGVYRAYRRNKRVEGWLEIRLARHAS